MENNNLKKYTLTRDELVIIRELLAQMSDGYFENEDFYNKYWMNFEVEGDKLVVYEQNTEGYEEAEKNPLFESSILNILHFFAEIIRYDWWGFLDFMRRKVSEPYNRVPEQRFDDILYRWNNYKAVWETLDNWMDELCDAIKNGTIQTDSDVEDFASERCLDEGKVFKFIAMKQTEGTKCEGCKYVMMRFNMYPCNSCARNCNIKDNYSQEGEEK